MHETKEQRDARMKWWREARFGLFIHWGLYAIPAGEWKEGKDYGEWIRNSAQIPLEEYNKFVQKFNPVKFIADEWVKMAKEAGMKYIVITSKHHDGFCMFDTKQTDFNVMSTPFKRDPLKELSDACKKEGIKLCFYHSIMDWHHPDYLPRRTWETTRSTEGANFDRYVLYLKNELKELLTNYGDLGVLWFDGEWESTWNKSYGNDLYNYVRSLQPNIIINNRVGAGRTGMEGFNQAGEFAGDFGTPEQEIPVTGMPDLDWETCMTMNDHWGYNKYDTAFKSSEDLLRKLADIASKGGNFLLNIGPTSEGVFPPTSIERLHDIGAWMKVNGESIYGTTASPFRNLAWGRCTQKPIDGGTRLYLHIFNWSGDGKLVVPGIFNTPKHAYLLADASERNLKITREGMSLVIDLPSQAPDTINSVIALDIEGKPDVSNPPTISAEYDIFSDSLEVTINAEEQRSEVRYTLDGREPTAHSPLLHGSIWLTASATVSARSFRDGTPASELTQRKYTKVDPVAAENIDGLTNGIKFSYYEGSWDSIPDFKSMKPLKEGTLQNISLSPKGRPEDYGFEYTGYVKVPTDGTYIFYCESDDGSKLYIANRLVVNNDYAHGMVEEKGVIALKAGFHAFRLQFFQQKGDVGLQVSFKGPGMPKQEIPDGVLLYKK
jgi:alpha-L-fucosidase